MLMHKSGERYGGAYAGAGVLFVFVMYLHNFRKEHCRHAPRIMKFFPIPALAWDDGNVM